MKKSVLIFLGGFVLSPCFLLIAFFFFANNLPSDISDYRRPKTGELLVTIEVPVEVESEEEFKSLNFDRILESESISPELRPVLQELSRLNEIDFFKITSHLGSRSLSYERSQGWISSFISIERKSSDAVIEVISESSNPLLEIESVSESRQ